MSRPIGFCSYCHEYASHRKNLSRKLFRAQSRRATVIRKGGLTISARIMGTTDDLGYNKHAPKLQLPEDRVELPTQGQSAVSGVQLQETEKPKKKQRSEVDYLSELLAIQQNGAKDIGFFGTRNMGFTHQKLVEILSYALVLTVRFL